MWTLTGKGKKNPASDMKEYRAKGARKTIYLEQHSDVIPYNGRNKRICDVASQESAVRNICNTGEKINLVMQLQHQK